jgi:hypothetical protein
MKTHRQKLEHPDLTKEEKELKECTFKPQINSLNNQKK